jgi:hypothetical protein
VKHFRAGTRCDPFAVAEPDPRASYSVRAHVDLAGDGRATRGDFLGVPGPARDVDRERESFVIDVREVR